MESEAIRDTTAAAPTEPEEGPADDVALEKRFFNLKTALSFAVAFSILYLLLRNVKIDVALTVETIRGADVRLYALGFLVYYSGFLVRAWRWQTMLHNARSEGDPAVVRPASVPLLAQIIYISWFANCLVPAKLGDVVRAYMLKRDTGVRFLKGMGTILAERILDFGVLLLLLSLAGFVTLRDRFPADVGLALEVGLALVIAAGLGLLAMRNLDGTVRRVVPRRFHERYTRFHEGTLRSFRSFPFVFGLTLITWMVEVGRLVFVTWAVGLRISDNLGTELLMLVFIALASAALTALPLTPAGLGLVEALIVKAFAWSASASGVQLANEMAWSIAILDRSISYGSLVLFGLVVYVISRRR